MHERRSSNGSGFWSCRSGSNAVEFALVAPMFILLMFGVFAYSAVMSTYSAVQQLVAEGARATVAGLTDTERDQLARAFIAAHASSYPFLDPTKLTVATLPVVGTPASFQVSLTYDMSGMFVYSLAGLVPLPGRLATRTAVVQDGSS